MKKLDLSKIIAGESVYYWSRVVVIGVMVGVSAQFVVAWSEPTGVAPNGNVGAPINTGDQLQIKGSAVGTGDIGTMGSIAAAQNIDALGDITAGGNVCNGSGECIGATGSIWTLNGNAIYNTNSGNVGIGTSSPAQKLHVAGSIRANGNFQSYGRNYYFGDTQRLYGDGGSAVYLNSNHATVSQLILRPNNGAITSGRLYGSGTSVGFLDADGNWAHQIATDSFHRFMVNNSEKVRILSNGNVGVGNSTPGYKFQVEGDIFARNWLRTDGNQGWYNDTHGGGWYMSDSTWVRAYNNKNVYTTAAMRADGGFQVDGRQMISNNGSWHKAQTTNNSNYGYFEVRRNDGTRGGYFGWGDGAGIVNIGLDNASYLDISGGQLRLRNLPNCTGKLITNAAGQVYCGTDQTGAGSGISTNSGCYDIGVPDSSMRQCNNGYAMTGALSYGQNQMVIRCCRLVE